MKSVLLVSTAILALSSTSHAAFSLTVSAVTGAANGVLTGLSSSTGVNNVPRVWGIIVDTNNDGIRSDYVFGASLAANASTNLSRLSIDGSSSVLTDDFMYTASALMVNSNNATLDGGSIATGNLARPTSTLNIATPNGSLNQQFYIVWFDEVALGGATAEGGKYGTFRLSSFLVPADGNTLNVSASFVGADPQRLASSTWTAPVVVPEPSAALLGTLGALGLLRRRRN